MHSTIAIQAETPDQPEIASFFRSSEAYMAALYPAESNHFVDVRELERSSGIFLVARHTLDGASKGAAVGCGAVVPARDGTGEIKRMWVDPAARGLKVGKRILEALEATAVSLGISLVRLETGVAQPEALRLYKSAGYVERSPFGDYAPDPLSVFMEKKL